MADNNKKRTNSFKKIFPSLFFSSKSKEKNSGKKITTDNNTCKSNTYQSPRSIIAKSENYVRSTDNNDDTIYENLSIANRLHVDNNVDIQNNEVHSNHSSSSTLVSENVKNQCGSKSKIEVINDKEKYLVNYSARPQVPPKPNTDIVNSMCNRSNDTSNYGTNKYPDVYYHSMEKLTNKISPIDEIEIYRASRAQAHPTSVGAEIKKVSTKFLISPKKEAEVRTIQPIRARSLSFEKDKHQSNVKLSTEKDKKQDVPRKSYNYSAPTSPIAVGHKIPNMPTTVSPYEHVRKTMIETEEKRNSLSRTSLNNKSTPSPSPQYIEPFKASSPIVHKHPHKLEDTIEREKTRQKVEAFYWQKIKEQKQREDEYFLRQSLNSSLRSPFKFNTSYSNSNRSTPSSFAMESKSSSLPRGRDLSYMINSTYVATPFVRGVQERRTDSYIVNRPSNLDPDIVYRNTETLNARSSPLVSRYQVPIIQRGSLTQEAGNINQQIKRVSFEEHYLFKNPSEFNVGPDQKLVTEYKMLRQHDNSNVFVKSKEGAKGPPLPPVRTTSVRNSGKCYRIVDNKRITHLTAAGYSVCSESESGSEAGEIQKILQSSAQKEEDWHGDGSRGDGGLSDGEAGRAAGTSRSRSSRRDDPRRHTLGGNHLYVNPHRPAQQDQPPEKPQVSKYQPVKLPPPDPRYN